MEALVLTAWRWCEIAWPHLLATSLLAMNIYASAHAILTKRDNRSTIGWVGLIWLSPGIGVIAYTLLGVNRIRSRASQLRSGRLRIAHEMIGSVPSSDRLREAIGPDHVPLRSLSVLVERITERPIVDGNSLDPLCGGDEAYPRMLAAIEGATRSVGLSSYIFDNDRTGKMFASALSFATKRGVDVRVLIDGIGASYTFPSIVGLLDRGGVRVERFLPTTVPFYFPYANLRNHRKILVVDGSIGFTGGLNIRDGCWLSHSPQHPIRDMHFEVRGPVVAQLLEVFMEDWAFASGQAFSWVPPASVQSDQAGAANVDRWKPSIEPAGSLLARGIRYGPDDSDMGRMKLVLVGALAAAQTTVRIMSPYFLPDDALCQALDVAAMRGVHVDIVIPEHSNLELVGWASAAMLWQVLGRGCNVWMSPLPFDHSKLMVVDGAWALLGSGNWDERSMRLNFEFNVEAYDRTLAGQLDNHIVQVISRSRRKTLAEVDARSLPVRLRDGVARRFSPYM